MTSRPRSSSMAAAIASMLEGQPSLMILTPEIGRVLSGGRSLQPPLSCGLGRVLLGVEGVHLLQAAVQEPEHDVGG